MKIWIVTAFDPIPEDGDQSGRYLALARLASAQGHEVHVFTSVFRHAAKTSRSTESSKEVFFNGAIHYHKIAASPYTSNRSWKRLLNHWQLSRNIQSLLDKTMKASGKPHVAIAACPPNQLALQAIKWFSKQNVPAVLDIHDLWPEAFGMIHPLFGNMGRQARSKALALSKAVVVTAEDYKTYLGTTREVKCIPFGLLKTEGGQLPDKENDKLRLVFSGSSEPGPDMLDIFRSIKNYPHAETDLYIKGTPNGKAHVLHQLEADNFRIHWNQSQEKVFKAISQADAGLSIIQKGAPVFFPNKAYEYLASGLLLLTNTPPGQLNRWLEKHQAGFAFEHAGQVPGLLERIKALRSSEKRQQIKMAAEQDFDRFSLSQSYMSLLEKLGK